MNWNEYKEQIVDKTPETDGMFYSVAVMWLNPSRLPIGVIGLGDCKDTVIKVPNMSKKDRTLHWSRGTTEVKDSVVPVVAISKLAFAGNKDITDIILQSNISMLPAGAFEGCSGLQRITIPKKITRIKEGTFAGCINLTDVYYEGTLEEWKKVEIVHEKHEIEFGELVPGTPVQEISAERMIHLPGNDALLTCNIHFRCDLKAIVSPEMKILVGGKDVAEFFKVKD